MIYVTIRCQKETRRGESSKDSPVTHRVHISCSLRILVLVLVLVSLPITFIQPNHHHQHSFQIPNNCPSPIFHSKCVHAYILSSLQTSTMHSRISHQSHKIRTIHDNDFILVHPSSSFHLITRLGVSRVLCLVSRVSSSLSIGCMFPTCVFSILDLSLFHSIRFFFLRRSDVMAGWFGDYQVWKVLFDSVSMG